MAEEFQAAVHGGSWWTSPRTAFNHSPCSSDIADMENFGQFWTRDLMYMKSKSSDESSDDSMVTTTISPDSAFQMMATAFSNSSTDTTTNWNQNLLLEHEGLNTFSTSGDNGSTVVTEADHQEITMDQQQSLNLANSSSDCTTFPISSTSYAYPSSLLQSYLNCNAPSQQPLYDSQLNSNNFNCPQPSPSVMPKQVPTYFKLTNNTPFWNASTSSLDDNISSFFSSPSESYKEKRPLPNLTTKHNHQEILDSSSTAKKGSGEVQFKRPRLETPSPLPTFKVRKEKLGDRITALQQLVSPFGKTDTASVLHEAIEYIKLLHDQVNILSAPYMKNVATNQLQQIHNKVKGVEGGVRDLRSLRLCLVPVSSTFPVANEMANGFWTPSFEGWFR